MVRRRRNNMLESNKIWLKQTLGCLAVLAITFSQKYLTNISIGSYKENRDWKVQSPNRHVYVWSVWYQKHALIRALFLTMCQGTNSRSCVVADIWNHAPVYVWKHWVSLLTLITQWSCEPWDTGSRARAVCGVTHGVVLTVPTTHLTVDAILKISAPCFNMNTTSYIYFSTMFFVLNPWSVFKGFIEVLSCKWYKVLIKIARS